MSDASSPIRIDTSELYSPKVNEFVEMQQALRRDVGPINPQPLVIRVIYSSWFYLSIASGLGGLCGWALVEPFFDEDGRGPLHIVIASIFFPTVAAGVGLFLGAAEGIMCRKLGRACISGLVGLGIGFVGGLAADLLVGERLYWVFLAIAFSMMRNAPRRHELPTGLPLLIIMMGRALAWAVISIPAGLGQGIAIREKKVIINGLVGALLGGLIGGLLFDPICFVFQQAQRATVARGVGFTIIGLSVGLFVGLVEGWTKTAWLLMRAGPLAGKQFVMFRDTTVLGSSPKAEIYLFKDEAIEPRHALIYNRGGRFEIEDCNSRDGTYVNGVPVRRQVLKHGDQVVLGKTVLEFQLKESRK